MVNFNDLLNSVYDQFVGLYSELTEISILGNPLWSYLMVPVVFGSMMIVLGAIKIIVLARLSEKLQEFDESSKLTGFTSIVDEVKRIISWPLIIIISLYTSIQHLNFDPTLFLIIQIFIYGFFFIFIYQSLSRVINVSTAYYESREGIEVENVASFIRIMSKTIVIVILLAVYLPIVGVNIGAVVASVGIVGIAIAFALQNVLEDLFATIVIYFDKPFELGDNIQVGEDVGTVEKIGIRSTHVRSVNGELIVFSNQDLTSNKIVNYKKMEKRRVTQMLGVSADTPVPVLREIPNMIAEIIETTDLVALDRVKLIELGDFSWNFEIVYYVKSRDFDLFRAKQHEINLSILEKLEQKEVEIPYPVQEIRIRDNGNTQKINPQLERV